MSTVIKSSVVKGKDLIVNLQNGNAYTYAGAADQKPHLDAAPSQGKYFNEHIKSQYPHSWTSPVPN